MRRLLLIVFTSSGTCCLFICIRVKTSCFTSSIVLLIDLSWMLKWSLVALAFEALNTRTCRSILSPTLSRSTRKWKMHARRHRPARRDKRARRWNHFFRSLEPPSVDPSFALLGLALLTINKNELDEGEAQREGFPRHRSPYKSKGTRHQPICCYWNFCPVSLRVFFATSLTFYRFFKAHTWINAAVAPKSAPHGGLSVRSFTITSEKEDWKFFLGQKMHPASLLAA